jgi:hypothetical protein
MISCAWPRYLVSLTSNSSKPDASSKIDATRFHVCQPPRGPATGLTITSSLRRRNRLSIEPWFDECWWWWLLLVLLLLLLLAFADEAAMLPLLPLPPALLLDNVPPWCGDVDAEVEAEADGKLPEAANGDDRASMVLNDSARLSILPRSWIQNNNSDCRRLASRAALVPALWHRM